MPTFRHQLLRNIKLYAERSLEFTKGWLLSSKEHSKVESLLVEIISYTSIVAWNSLVSSHANQIQMYGCRKLSGMTAPNTMNMFYCTWMTVFRLE